MSQAEDQSIKTHIEVEQRGPSEDSAAPISSARITGKKWLHRGRWLCLSEIQYQDEDGRTRTWETLERSTHGLRVVDAVEIIPVIKYKNKETKLVMVRQFRPPTGQYYVELPAGLVDEGETAQQASLRELSEETGYTGQVLMDSMPIMFGMAISSTTCSIVHVEIDGDRPENINPDKVLQAGEHTQVLLAEMKSLMKTLQDYHSSGDGIDAKLWLLAYALENAERLTK